MQCETFKSSNNMLSLLLIFVCLVFLYLKKGKIVYHLPGPWNFPIIGAMHLFDPKAPQISLMQMSRKYGKIFGLKIGLWYTVVISDASLLRKLFLKSETAARPPLLITTTIFNNKGVVHSQGETLTQKRKFILGFLKDVGAAKNSSNKITFQARVIESAEYFVKYLTDQGSTVVLDPKDAIAYFVTTVVTFMMYGKKFSRDDQEWNLLAKKFNQMASSATFAGAVNYLPFLRILPRFQKVVSQLQDSVDGIHEIIKSIIQRLTREFHPDQSDGTIFVNAYFQKYNKKTLLSNCDFEELKYLLFDLLGASTETTITSISWIILYLAAYQDVQERIRKELLEALNHRTPQIEDYKNLPYLEATLAEISRISPIFPLGFPHVALEDIKIEAFTIPKGAILMPLIHAIHMDPNNWRRPEEFSPDRFLDGEGEFTKSDCLLPFQIGKKGCVGEEMAKIMTFLFTAVLLQNFKINVYDKVGLDLTGIVGMTRDPKPQKIVFTQI